MRGERWAGVVVHRLPAFVAGIVLAAAVAATLLAPAQLWRPWVALPVLLLAAIGLYRWVATLPAPPVPIWTFCWSAVFSLGFAAWAVVTHAEHVVLRRDAGSYALYTHWLATRHGLPVDASLDAFGGAAALADPHFSLAAPAFYAVLHDVGTASAGASILPQFLIGGPAGLSLGWWAGDWWGEGWGGLFAVPGLVGGVAVLAAAALTARIVGPRWAPLGAGGLALAQPVLHAARSTYSEPFALLLVLVAAALLYDAVEAGHRHPDGARRLAWAAGLVAGLAGLVRVDALREVALLLPVAALLAARRHPAARPLLYGALGGVTAAAVADYALSRPYLNDIGGSLLPLLAITVALGAVSWGFVRWCRVRERAGRRPPRGPAWLPSAAGVAVLAGGALLAARPLFLTVRQSAEDPGARFVAGLQRGQGLARDGGRTYAEHSVSWLAWYVGPAVLILALLAAAAATRVAVGWWRRDGDPPVPAWLGPLFVGLASTVLTLWRPGITPDHPWADRRLVPVVLPFVVVGASTTVAWATREARRRLPATLLVAVATGGVVAVLLPAVLATWPVAGQRTERAEPDAVRQICDSLGERDAVLMLGSRARAELPQVVRGVCGRPAAVVELTPAEKEDAEQRAAEQGGDGAATLRRAVQPIAERITRAGYRPVLMTADGPLPLSQLGLQPHHVVTLSTQEDQRLLTRRPNGGQELVTSVWTAPWVATQGEPNG
jgi:hypothetical protein